MSSRLVERFCSMVRTDSESENESRFIEETRERLEEELGATCFVDAQGNLIAKVSATTDAPDADPIFLAAHADTVKPGIGIEPVVEDGVIRSKGDTILGADDKAGLAAIVEAVLTARRRPPVEIVVTVGEEVGLIGALNMDLTLLDAKRGVVADGDFVHKLIIGGPTYVSLDIEIVGKAAHAAEPQLGVSAIRVAAEAISALQDGQIDEETVANFGTIRGGVNRNGVPERVYIEAECRSLNHAKCVDLAQQVKETFEKEAASRSATANVELDIRFEASHTPEDAPIVNLLKQAVSSVGLKPVVETSLGGSDALILSSRGLEVALVGAGYAANHTSDERIAVADLEKVSEILRTLLELAAEP